MSTESGNTGGAAHPHARSASDAEDHAEEEAARLAADNPHWLIVWGAFSHEFVAYPLFHVPPRTVLACRTKEELLRRMRQVEQIYGWGAR